MTSAVLTDVLNVKLSKVFVRLINNILCIKYEKH